jgi:ribosomal-protein-alanine N-acetyltransferase
VLRIERAAFGEEALSATTFLSHLFRDRRSVFVAEDEQGNVLGYALVRLSLGWLTPKRGGITSIAVAPAHRRRGIGRALLGHAVEFLTEQHVVEADLEVSVSNQAAQSLYQSFGFRRTRLMPSYYGLNRDGLKMVLDLGGRQAARSNPHAQEAQGPSTGPAEAGQLRAGPAQRSSRMDGEAGPRVRPRGGGDGWRS